VHFDLHSTRIMFRDAALFPRLAAFGGGELAKGVLEVAAAKR
jgi:hypothetical protein